MPLTINILGAGAIGSLIGAHLATHHHVTLLCRPQHAQAITQHGLTITGNTNLATQPTAIDTPKNLPTHPDLSIITVKSYDTQQIITQTTPTLQQSKHILTLQNGLGNLETLNKTLPTTKIYAGITTHGAIFTKPGTITHTGLGRTIIGPQNNNTKTNKLVSLFNQCNIPTTHSPNIQKDLWIKAIINSSINPLTTIFQQPNGYLLQNPITTNILKQICQESTTIANTQGYQLNPTDMLTQTHHVIQETEKNYSSMLQSLQHHRPTEIHAINGYLQNTAEKHNIPAPLNTLITTIIIQLTKTQ